MSFKCLTCAGVPWVHPRCGGYTKDEILQTPYDVYFVVNKPLVDRFVSQSVCRFTSLFIACDLLDKNFFENDKFLFILIFL